MTAAVFIALAITAPFAFAALVEKYYTPDPDPHLTEAEIDAFAEWLVVRADRATGGDVVALLDCELWDSEVDP